MMLLSEDQLKNLNKEALVIIVSSLQDQLNAGKPSIAGTLYSTIL